MTTQPNTAAQQVSLTQLYVCIAIFALTHVLDLLALPFAVMSDSYAYVSWGLDVANLNSGPLSYSFEPHYQNFPYFPLGYPLLIGTLAAINRVATFDMLLTTQHLLLVAAVGLGLNYLRGTTVAFWVFFGLSLLAPELHSYPQTIMSEGAAMSLHLILVIIVISLCTRSISTLTMLGMLVAFFVTMIRGTPLLQIPVWCGMLFLWQRKGQVLTPAIGATLAGAVLVGYTYIHTAYLGLTTSDGFHLHNRLVFSQNLPLHLNPSEKLIVDAIGEETYRKPHWFVVDALYEKLGMKQGPAVNQLLVNASKPYIWIAPLEYIKNTFVLCFKSLGLNNDILLNYTHGWPIEAEAKNRQIMAFSWWYSLIDSLPGMRGNLIGWLFISICGLALITAAFQKATMPAAFYITTAYAALGLLIASSLSLDDYRRVREFFPLVIFAAAIASQRIFEILVLQIRGARIHKEAAAL